MGKSVKSPDKNTSHDVKSQYFELPHPVFMFGVSFGLILLAMCHFRPDAVPYSYLGPLGTLARYLVEEQPPVIRIIWYVTVFLHSCESLYSLSLSSAKGLDTPTRIKWWLSSAWFGGFSLVKLRAYEPAKR